MNDKYPDMPALVQLLLTIKTPQLIGIIAGVIVFLVTITSVILLLYYSGTFSRLKEELAQTMKDEKAQISPQFALIPQLYDHLLHASETLPIKPNSPSLIGRKVVLKPLVKEYFVDLIRASDGSALYSEGSYDPNRIWGWFGDHFFVDKCYSQGPTAVNNLTGSATENADCMIESRFNWHYLSEIGIENSQHITLFDPIVRKPVGMLSLLSNDPRNLTIKIGTFIFVFLSINSQIDVKFRKNMANTSLSR
jgi:hypothetical protein